MGGKCANPSLHVETRVRSSKSNLAPRRGTYLTTLCWPSSRQLLLAWRRPARSAVDVVAERLHLRRAPRLLQLQALHRLLQLLYLRYQALDLRLRRIRKASASRTPPGVTGGWGVCGWQQIMLVIFVKGCNLSLLVEAVLILAAPGDERFVCCC